MGVNDVSEAGIAEIMQLAEATPRRIAASTMGRDNTRLSQAIVPGEWSALEILNHLRACEEVWMHSVHAMLAHDNPRLQEIHPRQWIKTRNPYTTQTFANGLQVFTLRREALLITLSALSPVDWEREGRIDQKAHTVYSHMRRMVLHEDTHCDEIDALLK
jgi:hypothetical protein